MKPGERVRMFNVVPTGCAVDMGFNVVKQSKIVNVSDKVVRPKKMIEEGERCKAKIEKSLSLTEFKRKYLELTQTKDLDLSFYAYILKIISSKNPIT